LKRVVAVAGSVPQRRHAEVVEMAFVVLPGYTLSPAVVAEHWPHCLAASSQHTLTALTLVPFGGGRQAVPQLLLHT